MAESIKLYAGIGSRKTPKILLDIMEGTARYLAKQGYLLRSGGAPGADNAFEVGAFGAYQSTPWKLMQRYTATGDNIKRVTPTIYSHASRHSYKYDTRSSYVKKLMLRNVQIILGERGDQPVDFVVCWTPNGKDTGGTGVGLRVAAEHNIPIFNLHDPAILERITNKTGQMIL
tara:strand:- start:30893 stop:31411 length:519 start_codon:yes stop_codon:yes gene_type:complete